eukprot:961290-Amphidinium_carterae.2
MQLVQTIALYSCTPEPPRTPKPKELGSPKISLSLLLSHFGVTRIIRACGVVGQAFTTLYPEASEVQRRQLFGMIRAVGGAVGGALITLKL